MSHVEPRFPQLKQTMGNFVSLPKKERQRDKERPTTRSVDYKEERLEQAEESRYITIAWVCTDKLAVELITWRRMKQMAHM